MSAPQNDDLAASATDDNEEAQRTAEEVENDESESAGAAGADQLGDAGKKALDRMKAQRDQHKKELAAFKGLGLSADDLKALIAKSQEDSAKAEQARARHEVETTALAKANERLVRAEIKAAATGKLANPGLALRLLDVSEFDVNDDGEVDTDAIAQAISKLITDEPYLGVTQGDSKRFQGTGDAGPRGEAGKPQLTRVQVEQMAKEGKHAEIEQARLDGRLNALLGITT